MTLDEQDLREGLKFIVGTWQADYIVNAFSDDLAHIPATEFKTKDGRDFTSLSFEFFEDHTATLRADSGSAAVKATWEQTGFGTFVCTLEEPLDASAQAGPASLTVEMRRQEPNLVFALGFLAIALKKSAEGTVSEVKKQDIGDLEPSAEDLRMKELVGRWKVVRSLNFFSAELETKEQVREALEKQKADGTLPEDYDIQKSLQVFDAFVDFTDDYKVYFWTKLPDGVSQEDVQEAIKAGEIVAAEGDYFVGEVKEGKAVNGQYYFNTREHREVFGEVKSPWDKVEIAPDGTITLQQMTVLSR